MPAQNPRSNKHLRALVRAIAHLPLPALQLLQQSLNHLLNPHQSSQRSFLTRMHRRQRHLLNHPKFCRLESLRLVSPSTTAMARAGDSAEPWRGEPPFMRVQRPAGTGWPSVLYSPSLETQQGVPTSAKTEAQDLTGG